MPSILEGHGIDKLKCPFRLLGLYWLTKESLLIRSIRQSLIASVRGLTKCSPRLPQQSCSRKVGNKVHLPLVDSISHFMNIISIVRVKSSQPLALIIFIDNLFLKVSLWLLSLFVWGLECQCVLPGRSCRFLKQLLLWHLAVSRVSSLAGTDSLSPFFCPKMIASGLFQLKDGLEFKVTFLYYFPFLFFALHCFVMCASYFKRKYR